MKKNIIEFTEFCLNYLDVDSVELHLTAKRDVVTTTAAYSDGHVWVYTKGRALVDILRSIAHELRHLKQDVDGELTQEKHQENNAAGSPIENEANAFAGKTIRLYGEKNPEIYIS